MLSRVAEEVVVGLAVCALTCGAAGAFEYEWHLRMPPKLKPGAGTDRVEQEGGVDVVGYERRTVYWWPRKGQDVVDEVPGAPTRDWTVWTWQTRQPVRKFRARLIGFRGIGNSVGHPFGRGPGRMPLAPYAVLRLEDGSKKAFGAWGWDAQLCEADRQFIHAEWAKAWAKATRDCVTWQYQPRQQDVESFPPGETTIIVSSPHFRIQSGSRPSDNNRWWWVNERALPEGSWRRSFPTPRAPGGTSTPTTATPAGSTATGRGSLTRGRSGSSS